MDTILIMTFYGSPRCTELVAFNSFDTFTYQRLIACRGSSSASFVRKSGPNLANGCQYQFGSEAARPPLLEFAYYQLLQQLEMY